jgi:hypothetical protein
MIPDLLVAAANKNRGGIYRLYLIVQNKNKKKYIKSQRSLD